MQAHLVRALDDHARLRQLLHDKPPFNHLRERVSRVRLASRHVASGVSGARTGVPCSLLHASTLAHCRWFSCRCSATALSSVLDSCRVQAFLQAAQKWKARDATEAGLQNSIPFLPIKLVMGDAQPDACAVAFVAHGNHERLFTEHNSRKWRRWGCSAQRDVAAKKRSVDDADASARTKLRHVACTQQFILRNRLCAVERTAAQLRGAPQMHCIAPASAQAPLVGTARALGYARCI